MAKFTTEQLQKALIGLRSKEGTEAQIAYQMAYEEINKRMGDLAFDAWVDTWY